MRLGTLQLEPELLQIICKIEMFATRIISDSLHHVIDIYPRLLYYLSISILNPFDVQKELTFLLLGVYV